MTVHTPNYYDRFRCLAGECPHTCCQGWEVPIDRETARYYETIPGELGERLRALLTTDEEGDTAFLLRGDTCPFLTSEKLCELQIRLGEEGIGEICRSHPRFSYDFGPLTERGLCGSCPETARLILGTDMVLLTTRDEKAGEGSPALLSPLLAARETALELLETPEATLGQRFQATLLFANEVQVALDEGREEDIPQLCQIYGEEFPLLDPAALPDRREALMRCLGALEGLEILSDTWRALLARGKQELARGQAFSIPEKTQIRRAGRYFLYRHWLRGVWDGDVLTWAEFAALGAAVCVLLSSLQGEGFPEAFRLFCLELEHDQENLNALQDRLREDLSLAEMLAVAGLL